MNRKNKSRIFVKLVDKCNDCPDILFYNGLYFCKAKNEKINDINKIPDWCPLEIGEAIDTISSCESCNYAVYNSDDKDIWCSLSHKYILRERDYLIPNWCLLRIEE